MPPPHPTPYLTPPHPSIPSRDPYANPKRIYNLGYLATTIDFSSNSFIIGFNLIF